MTSLLAELYEWAGKELDYWEQAVLDKVIAGDQLTTSDYQQFLQYLREDKELAERMSQRREIRFAKIVDSSAAKPVALVRLLDIASLQNVNALAADQRLTFGEQLTVVYGTNGSGKSGYARVLGQVGFSRGDKEVLGDIGKPPGGDTKHSARIRVADGNGDREIDFVSGSSCPDLACLHIFDSKSVEVHLNEPNTISFTPPGLAYLTVLATETDKCRNLLREEIKLCQQPHNFALLFRGETEVSREIGMLGPKTNLKDLKKLAELSAADVERLNELEMQIARLKSEDVSEKLNELDTEMADLRAFIKSLEVVERGISDERMIEMNAAIDECRQLRVAARNAGIEQFRSADFSQTGTPTWNGFIKAAKALAEAESKNRRPYPHEEDRCLLCREPLTDAARALILKLWECLENEVQAKLDDAERELEKKRKAFADIELDCFNDQHVAYRWLREHEPELADKLATFSQAAVRKREEAAGAISTLGNCVSSSLPASLIAEIEAIITGLGSKRAALAAQDRKDEIAKLGSERLELEHRTLLGQHLAEIANYIEKLKWAAKAEKACGNTAHITKKYNALFEQRVTERYRGLFEQLLKEMGRPLKVRISTKGKKGETIKQIALQAEEKRVTPDKILSEGEKRAVAMADFLTEVTLNEGSGGIVLDDPVTSLDSEWKDAVARRLVNEATRRQVIIFTHDLQFVHLVNRHAELKSVSLCSHQIYRSGPESRPGHIALNYSPIQEKSYLDTSRAERCREEAERVSLSEREDVLRNGFGALRSCYEAFVAYDMFGNAVRRFAPNISIGSLKDACFDHFIIEEVISKFEFLSRYITGHLPADGYEIPEPTPALLAQEIEAFQKLRKKLKTMKAAKQK